MGWLDDRKVEYLYQEPDGTELTYEFGATEDPPEVIEGAKRVCLLPYKLGGYVKTQFERNGRIGYRIDHGDGTKPTIRSATREKWEHNVGNKNAKDLKKMGTQANDSVYSRGFQRHLDDQKAKKTEAAKALAKKKGRR